MQIFFLFFFSAMSSLLKSKSKEFLLLLRWWERVPYFWINLSKILRPGTFANQDLILLYFSFRITYDILIYIWGSNYLILTFAGRVSVIFLPSWAPFSSYALGT